MKTLNILTAFTSVMMIASVSQAYFVALYKKNTDVQYSEDTRILVSGRGTDLTILPQRSALGRAALYNRNFSKDQTVIISVFEGDTPAKRAANKDHLIKSGLQIVVENNETLNTASVTKELLKFTKIRSLEFFGHNSPSLGVQTDGLGARFDFREKYIDALAKNFTSDAYVLNHGCNSGWIIAPDMAKRWNVAFSGSFTQTRFERLHSDGHYYLYQTGKYPNSDWALTNPYLDNAVCIEGGCLRQRSAFSRYIGKWGDFSGPTLTHAKFICPLQESDCQKRMALSLYGFLSEKPLAPNSTIQDFRQTAKEYLCPVYMDRAKVDACINALQDVDNDKGISTIHFVVGQPQLTCTFKGCEAKMTCDDHTCVLKDMKSKGSETLVQEYLNFLKGYELLKADGQLP